MRPRSYSLRELEAATRDWSDGEFRAAGIKLENAVRAIDEVEAAAGITLTAYRSWLMQLLSAAAELHGSARQMQQVIDSKPDDPPDGCARCSASQVDRDDAPARRSPTPEICACGATPTSSSSPSTPIRTCGAAPNSSRFNDLFRAMFIDRHPAYPLYRHWYNLTEQSPEFPAPPTSEPTPRITEEEWTSRARSSASMPPAEPATPTSRIEAPRRAHQSGERC